MNMEPDAGWVVTKQFLHLEAAVLAMQSRGACTRGQNQHDGRC